MSALPKIAVLGARGRMGQWILKLIETEYSSRAQVAAKADRGDPLEALLDADAVIDFSSPEAFSTLARAALGTRAKRLPVFIVGTTGWKPEHEKTLAALAAQAPVLRSSNFSTGAHLLQGMLKSFSPALRALGYSPVIVETHHRHKKDAPSGTALMLARAVDPAGAVQTHSVRAGEVIGEHEIAFHGPADRITLSHSAQDRSIFARGAIDVALWLHQRRESLPAGGGALSMESYIQEILHV